MLCLAVLGTRLCIVSSLSSEEGCQHPLLAVDSHPARIWALEVLRLCQSDISTLPGRRAGDILVYAVVYPSLSLSPGDAKTPAWVE